MMEQVLVGFCSVTEQFFAGGAGASPSQFSTRIVGCGVGTLGAFLRCGCAALGSVRALRGLKKAGEHGRDW